MSADLFLPNISRWLELGQYQQIKNIILDRTHTPKVREHGMDIILGVCNHLNSEKTVWSPEMEECCEFSLLMVAQLSNPKEVLIALQEQVAEFGSSSKFKILLLPFQAVLLRLPDKQSNILNMVLETIGEHVSSLPLPSPEQCFEGKDRILLDTDPKVQCISDIYEALAEFYAPFVKQMSLNRVQTKLDDQTCLRERRRVLKKNLLKTMEQPLICMDLHFAEGKSPSLLRRIAEKLVHHLSCVCGDFFSLPEIVHHFQGKYKCPSSSSFDDGSPPPTLKSLGMIFYLVYGEQLSCLSVPSVYSQQFIFHTVLQYADLLLRSGEPLVVHKGLILIQGLLKHVGDSSLSMDCLDHPIHFQIFQSLIWLAVSGVNSREFKALSVELWRPYLDKLHLAARHHLLNSLLPTLEHPGLRGLVINIVKDQIALCLDKDLPYFLHDRLDAYLPLIWKLPQDVETDLLEHMDSIMSALNLARFLLLRDRPNVSGFAKHLPLFEVQFTEPLARALKLSRAHYEHYESELSKIGSGVVAICSVLLSMPEMSLEQRKSVITSAINSFDLLESVLARVVECLHSFSGSPPTCERDPLETTDN